MIRSTRDIVWSGSEMNNFEKCERMGGGRYLDEVPVMTFTWGSRGGNQRMCREWSDLSISSMARGASGRTCQERIIDRINFEYSNIFYIIYYCVVENHTWDVLNIFCLTFCNVVTPVIKTDRAIRDRIFFCTVRMVPGECWRWRYCSTAHMNLPRSCTRPWVWAICQYVPA